MEWFSALFDTRDFPARWVCGNWSSLHGWTHIVSDFAIFAAYMAIPIALVFFIRRRDDVPFLPVLWLFAAFIFLCGFGHLVEAGIFWNPVYRFSAIVKAATAIVSWATVMALIPIIPRALDLPGIAVINQQLERSNRELSRFANAVTGREERVIELKREVNEVLGQLGQAPRYPSALEASQASAGPA